MHTYYSEQVFLQVLVWHNWQTFRFVGHKVIFIFTSLVRYGMSAITESQNSFTVCILAGIAFKPATRESQPLNSFFVTFKAIQMNFNKVETLLTLTFFD